MAIQGPNTFSGNYEFTSYHSHFFNHLATEERQYGYLRNAIEYTAGKNVCEAFKNR